MTPILRWFNFFWPLKTLNQDSAPQKLVWKFTTQEFGQLYGYKLTVGITFCCLSNRVRGRVSLLFAHPESVLFAHIFTSHAPKKAKQSVSQYLVNKRTFCKYIHVSCTKKHKQSLISISREKAYGLHIKIHLSCTKESKTSLISIDRDKGYCLHIYSRFNDQRRQNKFYLNISW